MNSAQGIVGAPGRCLAVTGEPFGPKSFIGPNGEAYLVLGGVLVRGGVGLLGHAASFASSFDQISTFL